MIRARWSVQPAMARRPPPPPPLPLVGEGWRPSRRACLQLAAASLALSWTPRARAEDVPVPIGLQVDLLAKVAGYDKNLPARASVPPAAATLVQPAPGIASLPPASPALAAPVPPPLTALQKQIIAMPTIAKVKQYEKDAGFVIISAGKSQRVAKGTQFDLRRENAVVGRITIGDTIEEDESVGDLDPRSVPAGVVVEAGDEVIQVVNP